MATITKPLTVYIPDTRGVVRSPFGLGNLKIGPHVYTYSRNPGAAGKIALGQPAEGTSTTHRYLQGTCPGATEECQRICYARRPVAEQGIVQQMWAENSMGDEVPEIPEDARILRPHISGDFDTPEYILNWHRRLADRQDVTCWAYTRSWRVPALLPYLEALRALPNVQLFASMDLSTPELPPAGWRRAWIDGDERAGVVHRIPAHERPWYSADWTRFELQRTEDGTKALICPEETKGVTNCEECGFCISGVRNDVVFLEH